MLHVILRPIQVYSSGKHKLAYQIDFVEMISIAQEKDFKSKHTIRVS